MNFPQTILTLILSTGVFTQPAVNERWIVEKDGYLRIGGSTNVNKFTCSVRGYAEPDTLTLSGNTDRPVSMTGCISLPVSSIDCFNRMMNNDLQKTLNAKQHPSLNINFLSLRQYPYLKRTPEKISGTVYIELAGATKKFDIHYRVWIDEQQLIHLVGNQQIRFSDFSLTPPRRVGGAVRANDQLDVEFHIQCRLIANNAK